jgi:hypothetical protein
MPVLKIGGKTIDEIREAMKGDGKARLFGKTGEEARAHRAEVNAAFARKKESTSSDDKPNIASRTDFSDEKIAPKFKVPKKTAKEKVETPSGDMGSVDRTEEVIASGPDMSKVIKEEVKPKREFTATEMAQNLMSPGYNKKKGGMIKKMSSGGKVGSASKRADGCAMRGKTKGRMI